MSFDWKEYVYLAEELKQHSDEKYLRTSVSRAYYGVFCICRNQKGYKYYTKGDVHQKTISTYKNSIDKGEKLIGKLLDDLRRQRNKADYDEDKKITVNLADRVVLKAKKILKILG
ncbi:MAG TPA: hypothetical protein EYP22_10770 [Methanosarcinales archaeon]|nr:hypothetical protein [Methanosarcinales archaeon]